MSSISSIYNSVTRVSGLSGLDVDGLVKSLMQIERTKVDKVSQDRQMLLWKQEKYRAITSALQGFNNEYFNSLKPAADMRNSAIYSAFAVKYDGLDTSAYFSATAGVGAKAGDYTIKNIVTALAAKVTGTAAAGGITGASLTTAGINGISSIANNNKVNVTLNGIMQEITIKENPADITDLRNDLQGKLDTAFGSGKITVGVNVDKLTFATSNTNTLSLSAVTGNNGLTALGFASANTSNKLDMSAKLYDIRNYFAVPLTVSGTAGDISFAINGQTFQFDSNTTSMNDILAAVNSNTAANVKMSYDSTNNKFIVETKQTGVTASITTSETSGGLLGSLSLIATGIKGRDASLTFNDGINGDQVVARPTNSVSISGITFDLKKDNAGSVILSVSSNPSKVIEMIKGFVNKYNEVLNKINTELSESRDYNYIPLTDDQKESMSEEQIKQWEDKTKTGLLASDGMLKSIVSNMRNALIESVQGAGVTLSSIGIKSSAWTDKGKLYIDEEKLKTALSENPDQVISLFTNKSDVTYNSAASDPLKKTERFNESGLIDRLSDILQDNIRTTTINGQRGALLEKAGMTGDRSLFNNILLNQITNYDKRINKLNEELIFKENSYYSQFARLETLINNMNSQSNWMTQQFK